MTAPCRQGKDVGVLSDKVLSDFMCISFHFSRFVTSTVYLVTEEIVCPRNAH